MKPAYYKPCYNILYIFIVKGTYVVLNLMFLFVYPYGIRQKVSDFALQLRKEAPNVNLVAVGRREFYVYRYEGELNDIQNAVVLFSYPKKAFGNAKVLRVFISTNVGLSTEEILCTYTCRWPIEIYFRQSKNVLAFGDCQIRSKGKSQ